MDSFIRVQLRWFLITLEELEMSLHTGEHNLRGVRRSNLLFKVGCIYLLERT